MIRIIDNANDKTTEEHEESSELPINDHIMNIMSDQLRQIKDPFSEYDVRVNDMMVEHDDFEGDLLWIELTGPDAAELAQWIHKYHIKGNQ